VLSGLVLLGVSAVADQLEQLLWTSVPQALGLTGNSPAWVMLILTLTGAAVGLVIWKVPGHAGPDPATTGLIEAPLAPAVLPSLLLALVLMLAGGVSLGPENPIMAVNTGMIVALGHRLLPRVGQRAWVGLASAGMIAAMFGTPVAAALLLSEAMTGDGETPLWDRLFLPLVAAGAGALTTDLLAPGLSFALPITSYPGPQLMDLVTGCIIASLGALCGLAAVYAFPRAHELFHRIQNPLLMVTAGGILLGVLGVVGGPVSLFKGFDQMKELTQNAASYSAGGLAMLAIVKLVAMLIAGTSGFRGGRIFPSVFVGVALGLSASALVPAVPQALAVPCAVLGVLLAISRQGWLSIFLAAALVPDVRLLPILSVVILPAWLLITGRPQMIVSKDQ